LGAKKKQPAIDWFNCGLSLVGIILGLSAKRNIPVFVLFSFPYWAQNLRLLTQKIKLSIQQQAMMTVSLSLINLFILILILQGELLGGVSAKTIKLDFVDNQFAASDYFRSLNIQGNIFNNYDIGSYLIFTLAPETAVFVDNRPEAYGQDFFQDLYIPMQEDNSRWQAALTTYQFQAIIFGIRDLTDWGRLFLAQRLQDSNWQLVYQDEYTAIFLPADQS